MDTKTDRELIELAAKAVEHEGYWHDRFGGQFIVTNKEGVLPFSFNPLVYDQDAFRLAVDLNLFGTPGLSHYLSVLSFIRGYDKYTLMRSAIVMAAAKIGEGVE